MYIFNLFFKAHCISLERIDVIDICIQNEIYKITC